MRNLEVSNLLLLFFFIFLLVLESNLNSATGRSISPKKPCKRLVLYTHNILFNGTNSGNLTSVTVTSPPNLGDLFGTMVIFDDPVTRDNLLGSAPVARAQGFYFYDQRKELTAWLAFSLVFNSTEHKGTLQIMGADPYQGEKTRYLSVVGGTEDFFMARGVVDVQTDEIQGLLYFRLKMDVNLYECY